MRFTRQRILESYLCEKHDWDTKVIESINWESYSTARKKWPKDKLPFLDKWIYDWLPVVTMLAKQDKGTNACHLCSEEETGDHLVLCRHRAQWRGDLLAKVQKCLIDLRTEPEIHREIVAGLRAWLDGLEANTSAQTTIFGWWMFFFLSNSNTMGE